MKSILFMSSIFMFVNNVRSQVQIIPLLTDTLLTVSEIDVISQDTIVFASGSKIFKTTNGGVTWDSSETNLPNIQKLDFVNINYGVVTHPLGLKKTVNGGITWDSIDFVPAYSYRDCHVIDTSHFIVANDSGYIRHIYKNYYVDDTLVDPFALSHPVAIFDFDFINGNEGFGSGVVNGFSAVIHTMDNGLTWDVRANSGFLYLYMHEISFYNQSMGGAIELGPGLNEKISFTSDGGFTWVSGYWPFFQDQKMAAIDFTSSGVGIVIGLGGTIYVTSNFGQTWDTACVCWPNGPNGVKIKIVNDSVAYLGAWDGIYKITNFATSVNDNNLSATIFTIFPSPSSGKFTISMMEHSMTSKSIEIYNTDGRIIFQKEKISDKTLQVDLSHEAKGVYFVKVTNDVTTVTKKLILQ